MRVIEDTVSIVGMGCVFPGAPDPATFWENICAKRSFIADHPDPHSARYLDPGSRDFERVYSLRGGYLGPLATFDPTKHGVMPADVQNGDSDQFLTLRAATAAVEDAGIDLDAIRRVAGEAQMEYPVVEEPQPPHLGSARTEEDEVACLLGGVTLDHEIVEPFEPGLGAVNGQGKHEVRKPELIVQLRIPEARLEQRVRDRESSDPARLTGREPSHLEPAAGPARRRRHTLRERRIAQP